MKKKRILILSSIAVAVAAILTVLLVAYATKPVVTIDGVAVGKEEYTLFMQKNIANVVNSFNDTGASTGTDSFWSTPIEGRTPFDVLHETTLEDLKRTKAIYRLAVENQLVDAADYSALLARMKKENEDRAEKIKNNQPVYGLSRFTFQDYLDYEMDRIQKAICEKFSDTQFQNTEEEIQNYYDTNKANYFTRVDDVDATYLKIEYSYGAVTPEQTAALKIEIQKIAGQINEAASLKSLVEKNELLKPYSGLLQVNQETYGSLSKLQGDVLDEAMKLNQGEVTQVLDNGSSILLIQCDQKTEHDYREKEEVLGIINKNLREDKYNALISEKAKAAVVIVDKNKVEAIQP